MTPPCVPPVALDLEALVLASTHGCEPPGARAPPHPTTSICGALLVAVDPTAALLSACEYGACVRAFKRSAAGLAKNEEEREAVWRFDCTCPETGAPHASLLTRLTHRLGCTLVVVDGEDMWCFGRPGDSTCAMVLERAPAIQGGSHYLVRSHARGEGLVEAVDAARREYARTKGLGLPGCMDKMTIARLKQVARALGAACASVSKPSKAALVAQLTRHVSDLMAPRDA